jgi:hypothetical protein
VDDTVDATACLSFGCPNLRHGPAFEVERVGSGPRVHTAEVARDADQIVSFGDLLAVAGAKPLVD